MEEDRLQTDLGIAADIEEAQLTQASSQPTETAQNGEQSTMKQPKKRFVGRRAAAEAAAAKNGTLESTEGSNGAVQGMMFSPVFQ